VNRPGQGGPRPSHPHWQAIVLLIGVCLALVALAAMSTFGIL
jgi:hypothetical protein